jgi:hypothetical protein
LSRRQNRPTTKPNPTFLSPHTNPLRLTIHTHFFLPPIFLPVSVSQSSNFNVQRSPSRSEPFEASAKNGPLSTFKVQSSKFNVQCSTFNVRRSTFPTPSCLSAFV